MVYHDLEFVLQHRAAAQFVLQHQPSRRALLQLLSSQWRLNPQRRELREHVLFEAETWRTAFFLEQGLERTLQTLELTVRQAPWEQSSAWHGELLAELRVRGAPGAASGSSFHLRLLRHLVLSLPLEALAAALQGSGAQGQPPLAAWLALFPAADLALMLQHAAGAYLFSSEVRAGLWVRNGGGLRSQAELYGDCNWQSQDLAVVQFAAALLGLHGSPGHEPAALLQGLGRERLGEDPEESAREASLEAFWELASRAAAEAWQLGVCAAHRGSPEYAGEAARRALRRWILHALASRALSASALREQLPWGWQDCPAVDEVVREVATSKVGEDGALKFELKQDSWSGFDCLLMVRGQRLPPEAEENAAKHKSDLLGPVRERGTCQVWRDAVLAALDRPCLRAALSELVCRRGSARAESAAPPGTGALLWALKMLDMLQALGRARREAPAPGAAGVAPGAAAAGGGEAPQEAFEEALAALRGLKEKETGTVGHVCSRVLARSQAPEPTTVAQDREAQKAAKRQTLAARQKAVLQSMAARQQHFAAMAGGEDDMDVDEEPGESVLYCDVCREASRPDDPICLLAHSCRTTALERLARHRDFAGPSLAVSTCGHLVHASCVRKHREYFQSQRSQESLFHLSRPGPGSVLCPMCRTLSSCVLPVLPARPLFQAPQEPSGLGSTAPAGGSSPSGAASIACPATLPGAPTRRPLASPPPSRRSSRGARRRGGPPPGSCPQTSARPWCRPLCCRCWWPLPRRPRRSCRARGGAARPSTPCFCGCGRRWPPAAAAAAPRSATRAGPWRSRPESAGLRRSSARSSRS
ncbi:unnamed protein product [Prorocentrum cordatum]|uniref:E3 ubiquitin-protein ligase n=1 Tax=Prorocentrum cordatum TaxID=2364126 RepID=A0ABN9Q114_9DINO|nr:unnamed protein product [Polarella glacialis]